MATSGPTARETARDSVPCQPLQTLAAQRCEGDTVRAVSETLAAEVPVAMQFNGRSHAVMLATPADLDDFALGFSATEGIIRRVEEVRIAGQDWSARGVVLDLRIPEVRFALLEARERNLSGRTGTSTRSG